MMISKTKISTDGFEKFKITPEMAEIFGLPMRGMGYRSEKRFLLSIAEGSVGRGFCFRQIQQSSEDFLQGMGSDVWG